MNYIEVWIKITPFSEDFAEQVMAQIEELPYESFITEEPFLKAYIPEDKYSSGDLKTLLSAFDGNTEFSLSAEAHFVKEENWNIKWESNFSPIVVNDLCTVKASFHKGLPKTKYTITIDPKMAFGTGHHQTTHLMIEALLNDKIKGVRVLDMGCGTGILSILAAMMGAATPVHAIDIDHLAVDSTKENGLVNGVSENIICRMGDASLLQAGRYDLILANINRNIIISDIKTYYRSLVCGGRMFLSGFYTEDVPLIMKEAEELGLELVSQNSRDNWAVIKLKKVSKSLDGLLLF